MVTGLRPHEKRMRPPLATAATTAADVQPAAVPLPMTRVGRDVSTARASAGTAAWPAGLPNDARATAADLAAAALEEGFEAAFAARFAGAAAGAFAREAGAEGTDADGEPAVPARPALPAAGTVAVVVPTSAAAVDEAGALPQAARAAAVAAV